AFKSGARISARSYSLLAMLAHWTRRHRTFALSVTVAITLLITGSLLYIRNVASERDRADSALEHAEAARNDLVLEHSTLLLHSDPTAALTALNAYHGNNEARRSELVAEAKGRGVAQAVLHAHNDTIWCLAALPDG